MRLISISAKSPSRKAVQKAKIVLKKAEKQKDKEAEAKRKEQLAKVTETFKAYEAKVLKRISALEKQSSQLKDKLENLAAKRDEVLGRLEDLNAELQTRRDSHALRVKRLTKQ